MSAPEGSLLFEASAIVMTYKLSIDNTLTVLVTPKPIKHLRMAVYPPDGEVRISAPFWISAARIKYFVLCKIDWIRKQQMRILHQPKEPEPQFVNMERHYVWGEPCLLAIHPNWGHNGIELNGNILHIRTAAMPAKNNMKRLLQSWYRHLAESEGRKRIESWRSILNLPPVLLYVRQMKSRWGSCLPANRKILLNTQLAKKPRECLDYVVLHELAHFFIPNHGKEFRQFMARHLPTWESRRELLNSFPPE